uniref:Laminin N-terminal domain-containing protein n=1 Tax=Laticauda laticaudata TaxID=8630 RepID=A0A8C5SBC0_LATLA
MPCFLFILCSVSLPYFLSSQNSCHLGACHPSVGDLLVGRSQQLTASSTCGLFGPQKYCIVGYLEAPEACMCNPHPPTPLPALRLTADFWLV